MSRNIRLYLEDIQSSCGKILHYTDGMNMEDFLHDDRTYDAVVRNLEIIGEAAKNLNEEFRKKNPQIEWRALMSFRNIMAHEYFGIKDEILWDVIQNKIPTLANNIQMMIDDQSNC
jgi:uncharacterized protein with HEPN domain